MVGENKGIIAPQATNSPMVVANNSVGATISVNQNQEFTQLIETVKKEFRKIEHQLPPELQTEAAKHLENMEAAVKSKDKVWYSISAKGLLDASKYVKDFAGNIFGAIAQVGKLLWPDFELKQSKADDSTKDLAM